MRNDLNGATPASAPIQTDEVPVVKADTAMTSLRASGHDFNSAVGEVVDNSLEAGANVVQIRTFTAKKKIGNNTKAVEVIDRVAIGDDGEGMEGGDHGVLHRCLQLGYSTRYNSRLGLGRFGVGAKIAGISQAKKIEVYSRQAPGARWAYTFIDLREIEAGKNAIPVPVEAELPEDCQDLVGTDRGTLVVWSDADKLQERETGGARQASNLEASLVTYVSRTFRKFLDGGKKILVNETAVLPHDPLFQMTSTRFHQVPEKTTLKLPDFPAGLKFPRSVADKVFYDARSKLLTYKGSMTEPYRALLLSLADQEGFVAAVQDMLGRKPSDDEAQASAAAYRGAVEDLFERSNPDPVSTVLLATSFEWDVPNKPGQTSTVEVTVTQLPEKFWSREKFAERPGGNKAAKERHLDENEGVTILRAGREIFYDHLRKVQPQPKEADRFIGIEIRFRPELDECFRVRNVKRGAEPVNGLRDKLTSVIHNTVLTARSQMKSRWATLKAQEQQDSGAHAEAEGVVADAKDVSPQPRAGEGVKPEERRKKVEEAATALTPNDPVKRKQLVEAMLNRPINVVPQAWPGGDFISVEHLGTTAIVRLNTQHPFYTQVYSRLAEVKPDADPAEVGRVARVGIDLLLMSYAQAEATDKEPERKYGTLRAFWGTILKNNIQEWGDSREE
jgi:hypothetical protein